jgi:hypothetical protein
MTDAARRGQPEREVIDLSPSMGVDSYDDDDHHVQVEDGVSATETQPRPVKRRGRTGASATTSGQKHHGARRITPATSISSQNRPCNQPRLTNSPGAETISVQGYPIRKIFLSRIEYHCCFTEDRGRSTAFKPDTVIPSLVNIHNPPLQTSRDAGAAGGS